MFYLIIAIIVVVFSGKMFIRACGTISIYRPNMMSVLFYYYLILQNVIGAVLVVNEVDHHYMIAKLQYDSSRIYGYWAIMYTMIAFPLGMLLTNLIWKENDINSRLSKYCAKNVSSEVRYNDKCVKWLLLLMSLVAVVAVVYVLYVIREIPLLKMISGGDALDLALFRGDVSRHFPGNEYVKNMVALGLTPFLSYVAYGYKKLENSFINKLWFYSMLFFSALIVTYNLSKAPIIIYLFGFLFFYIYTGGYFTKKMLVIIGGGMLFFVILLYMLIFASFDSDLFSLFYYNSGIVGRLTLSSSAGLFLSFDLFPHNYDFIGFSSISELLSDMFNLSYTERSQRIIMDYVNPSGVDAGTAGVVNSLFIGEAWTNWGIIGVILSPIIVGAIIQTFYLFILHSPKTPFFLALFVYYSFNSSLCGGINSYIYNIQTIELLFVIFIIYGGSLLLTNILYANHLSHSS